MPPPVGAPARTSHATRDPTASRSRTPSSPPPRRPPGCRSGRSIASTTRCGTCGCTKLAAHDTESLILRPTIEEPTHGDRGRTLERGRNAATDHAARLLRRRLRRGDAPGPRPGPDVARAGATERGRAGAAA